MIDLEMTIKVNKSYEDGKLVIGISHLAGLSHSIIATILKSKNKVTEAMEGSALLKATRPTKI